MVRRLVTESQESCSVWWILPLQPWLVSFSSPRLPCSASGLEGGGGFHPMMGKGRELTEWSCVPSFLSTLPTPPTPNLSSFLPPFLPAISRGPLKDELITSPSSWHIVYTGPRKAAPLIGQSVGRSVGRFITPFFPFPSPFPCPYKETILMFNTNPLVYVRAYKTHKVFLYMPFNLSEWDYVVHLVMFVLKCHSTSHI